MRITAKGQVAIPKHIRHHLGISDHSEVDFLIRDGAVVLVKMKSKQKSGDSGCKFSALRGTKHDGVSTDDWMDLTRGEVNLDQFRA